MLLLAQSKYDKQPSGMYRLNNITKTVSKEVWMVGAFNF